MKSQRAREFVGRNVKKPLQICCRRYFHMLQPRGVSPCRGKECVVIIGHASLSAHWIGHSHIVSDNGSIHESLDSKLYTYR